MICKYREGRLTHIVVGIYLYYLQPAVWQASVQDGLRAEDEQLSSR